MRKTSTVLFALYSGVTLCTSRVCGVVQAFPIEINSINNKIEFLSPCGILTKIENSTCITYIIIYCLHPTLPAIPIVSGRRGDLRGDQRKAEECKLVQLLSACEAAAPQEAPPGSV